MNRILIVGAEGQLGTALSKTAPETIVAAYLDRPYLDITQESSVQSVVDEFRPYQILNVAGYTDVDRAEQEPETAFAVNGQGVANLASAAKRVGSRLLHLSTDYVFDGASETPYRPDEQPNPLNVYGKSKLAGEAELARILPGEHLVVRTAWLYSPWGENFVKTMLRLMREKEELCVVADQVGSPTSAEALAEVLWRLVARSDLTGIYHWTDVGETSWYDFACAIHREGLQLGLLERPCQITPITTQQLSRPAPRPHYSALDSSALCEILDLQPEPWSVSLRKVLTELSL
ncbi:MAG: dTDP-4-dehydrorhamnose reductase [Planctomycetia bacterium]|jgi:dTDP-4-dehydrorhamnose reductase